MTSSTWGCCCGFLTRCSGNFSDFSQLLVLVSVLVTYSHECFLDRPCERVSVCGQPHTPVPGTPHPSWLEIPWCLLGVAREFNAGAAFRMFSQWYCSCNCQDLKRILAEGIWEPSPLAVDHLDIDRLPIQISKVVCRGSLTFQNLALWRWWLFKTQWHAVFIILSGSKKRTLVSDKNKIISPFWKSKPLDTLRIVSSWTNVNSET